MARIALSIAGGIIGSLIPGLGTAVGFALGSAIGGIIGSFAFPGQGQHVYGPRVTDMQISGATPGTVIPLLFGTMRLGGQIIWSNGIVETTTNTNQSAKGGPSVTQTAYTYACSFAAAFCQGEAVISRVWGDSKLIVDYSGTSNPVRGTWDSATTYNVDDLITWTDSNTYICMVANVNELPNNSNFWAQDLAATNPDISTYTLPTLYTGSETQNADPLIVSIEGATVTPAYRGVCYAVWENFPLADFGNRVPNIRAEVSTNSTEAAPLVRVPWTFNSDEPVYSVTDPQETTAFLFGAGTHVARIDLVSNTVTASGVLDISHLPFYTSGDVPTSNMTAFAVDNQGYIWTYGTIGGQQSFIKFDGWTFQAVASLNISTLVSSYAAPVFINVLVNSDGTSLLVASGLEAGGSNNVMYGVRCSDNTLVGVFSQFYVPEVTGDTFAVPVFGQHYPVIDNSANVYFLASGYHSSTTPFEAGDWYIWKISLTGGTSHFVSPGPQYTDYTRFDYTGDSSIGLGDAMLYDPTDNTLIVYTVTGAFLKIDANDGTILDTVGSASDQKFYITLAGQWQNNIIGGPNWLSANYLREGNGNGNSLVASHKGRVQNGVLWAPDVSNVDKAVVYSASDFGETTTYDLTTYTDCPILGGGNPDIYNYGNVYNTRANALVSFNATSGSTVGYPSIFPTPYALHVFYLDRVAVGGFGADQIVSSLCQLAGIAPENSDVSQLANIAVTGYPITQLGTGKDILTTLGQAYFFEGRETDFKLQFVPRGQPSLLTIPEPDLGLSADKAKLVESIGQEQDLPKDVEVLYIDPNQDYQQGQMRRVRHSKTTKSLNQTSISLPLVMTQVQAAQLADKIMWTAENERRTYKSSLYKAVYMLLDPCDVIECVYDGVRLTGRVTQATAGQNYATELLITSEDSNNYLSTATGVGNSGFIGQTIQGLAPSQLWLLDIPYLQDTDADASGNLGYYFAMAPQGSGKWKAGVLYNSSDAAVWNQIDAIVGPIAYGIAKNVLAAPHSAFTWDGTNSLTLTMVIGSGPASDTTLNVLNGRNAAILYPSLEVIQFETVVHNGDGTYTLSNLLRGRRGTEWACGSHTTGEIVLFPLEQGGIKHEQGSSSLLNSLRYYKGVTVGADLNTGTVQEVSLKGRDLMPYAPAQFTGSKGGSDFVLTWVRRTRLGGQWQDGIGNVPLNEDTESYDVDIYNGSTVVRTFSNITPPGGIPDSWMSPAQPHVTYTAAEQTTDFGSTQNTIKAIVYQNSAQVGRGFPSENDSIT
jgi:hypothetical protein